jgi:hypothetical protein
VNTEAGFEFVEQITDGPSGVLGRRRDRDEGA